MLLALRFKPDARKPTEGEWSENFFPILNAVWHHGRGEAANGVTARADLVVLDRKMTPREIVFDPKEHEIHVLPSPMDVVRLPQQSIIPLPKGILRPS